MLLKLLNWLGFPWGCPRVRVERRTHEPYRDPDEERRAAAASCDRLHPGPRARGVRTDPARAAHDAGLEAGDVGSDRYHRALGYLRGESALVGDEHTATRAGAGQHHGYAAYFFTWRGVRLLEG